jgi:hypothetical protein
MYEWSSHSSGYDSQPKFRRNISPPTLVQKNKPSINKRENRCEAECPRFILRPCRWTRLVPLKRRLTCGTTQRYIPEDSTLQTNTVYIQNLLSSGFISILSFRLFIFRYLYSSVYTFVRILHLPCAWHMRCSSHPILADHPNFKLQIMKLLRIQFYEAGARHSVVG